jgi:tetratricopeptide (TPR) repeat protein
MLIHLQIIPLDMTACETWFYFPMVGLLGMIGLIIMAFPVKIRSSQLILLVIAIMTILGARTAIRGTEWSSLDNRASHDIEASKEHYVAYSDLAEVAGRQGNFVKAKEYELRSIEIYPTYGNLSDLGFILSNLGDYAGAQLAYSEALKHGYSATIYQNLAELALAYGDPTENKKLIEGALQRFPHNTQLWIYLALLDAKNGDIVAAKAALSIAEQNGDVPRFISEGITNSRPFDMRLAGIGKTITIK